MFRLFFEIFKRLPLKRKIFLILSLILTIYLASIFISLILAIFVIAFLFSVTLGIINHFLGNKTGKNVSYRFYSSNNKSSKNDDDMIEINPKRSK